jgi:hypothetical protein
MINSGVYDFAEVDLQGSVHLAGDNNTGKTSLISAFQFLYVDNWTEMKFTESRAETEKYYFRENSYILIEVNTGGGLSKLVGFRGLGAQGKEPYERFVVNGTFDRNDFMDGDLVREWPSISQDFLLPKLGQGQKTLTMKREELRNAMTGVGESNGVRLGLIPPTNSDTFIKVFQNLLALKRTREADLKTMILDSLGDILQMRTLDLARECETMSKDIQKRAYTLGLLEEAAPEAKAIEKDYRTLTGLLEDLPLTWETLNTATYRAITLLGEQLVGLDEAGEMARTKRTVLVGKLGELAGRKDGMTRQQAKAEQSLAVLDGQAKRFEGDRIEALLDQPRLLNSLLEPLRGQLTLAANPGARKDLESRLHGVERERGEKQARLNNPSVNWSARILGECSEDERATVLRLFHPDLLAMQEGAGKVTVKDEALLFKRIDALNQCVRNGVYEDAGIRLDINGIAVPKTGIFDPVVLEKEIEALAAEEERLRELLKEVASFEHLQREVKALEARYSQSTGEVALYTKWQEEEQARPEYERLANEAAKALKEIAGEKADFDQSLEEVDERLGEIRRQIAVKQGTRDILRAEAEAFAKQVNPDWVLPGLTPETRLPTAEELPPLLTEYRTRFVKASSLSESVDRGLRGIQNRLGSLLPGFETADLVAKLMELMDTIPERQEVLLKNKRALVVQASRRFQDFHKGFGEVKAWVSRINSDLAKIQVSNLRSVQIVLAPTDSAGIIENLVDAQTSPLFAVERTDEAVQRIVARMDNKQIFTLEELFQLHIKVIKANGEAKLYDKLDAESTGTGMTFKIVLMAMLLREIAKAKTNLIRFPLFVDEADTLDDTNRTTILNIADSLGFNVVMASPNAVPAHRVYFLHLNAGGKTWITNEDEHLELEEDVVGGVGAGAPLLVNDAGMAELQEEGAE